MSKESQNKNTYSGKQAEGEILTILCKQRSLEENRIQTMNCWRNCTLQTWETRDVNDTTLKHRKWCSFKWEKIEGRRRRGRIRGWDGWMAAPTRWTWTWANFGRRWRTGTFGVHGVTKSRAQLGDWATPKCKKKGGKIHSHLVARSKEKFSKNMADLPYVINKTCLTDTSVTGPQRSLRCIMIFKHTRTFATIKGYALKETSKIINGLQLYVYSQTKRIWN